MEGLDSSLEGVPVLKNYTIHHNGRRFNVFGIDLTRMVYEAEGSYEPKYLSQALRSRDFSIVEIVGDGKPKKLGVKDFIVNDHYAVIFLLAQNGQLNKYEQPVTVQS